MNKPNTEVSQSYQNGEAEQGVPVGYKQTEIGIIPEDWEQKKLGELANIFSGGTPNRKIAEYWNGDIPWVTTTLIGGSEILHSNEFITQEGVENSSAKWCGIGTILMAMYGQGKTRGKAALLGFNSTINQACAAIELKDLSSNKYVFHKLRSMYEEIRELSNSGGQENLSSGIIKNIIIPYPPKQEQTAIANALSDVDALLSELENLIAKKQAIKNATMQQLLTGRTRLPQFAHHPDGSKKGYKQSELGEIPEDWATRTYGEIFSFLTTSTNSRSDLSDNGEYGYIHYGDIHTLWSNFLDLDKRTTPKIEPVLVRSAFIQDGDLVMADASEDYVGIGKSIEIKNIGNKLIVAGLHTYLLRDSHSLFVDGFRGYLHEIPAVKSMIDKLATGMKVYGISKGNLEGIYLLIPSKEEQTAIATILSDMDAEIQALEQRLNKTRDIKQGMMQQLLTGKIRLPVEAYN